MSTGVPGVKDSALQPHLVPCEVTQVSCPAQVGGGGTEGDAHAFCGARPLLYAVLIRIPGNESGDGPLPQGHFP